MTDSKIDEVLKAAQNHAREVVAPNITAWIKSAKWPRDASDQAAKVGLTGLYCEAEWGGQGLSLKDAIRVYEQLGKADGAYAFTLSMHNICAYAICNFASENFKQKWAKDIVTGKKLANFSLTEPQSGSDAANIQTSAAIADNGDYIINGHKAWVSLATEADVYLVVTKTQKDEGAKSAAMIAVPKDTKGLGFSKVYQTPSYNFLPIADMFLENVRVPQENIILPPGQGLQGALMAIDIARTSIASGCAGLIDAALQKATDYAYKRKMFGKRCLDLETIQWMLADVYNDLAITRLLYQHAAALLGSEEGRVAAAHAKLFAPAAALKAASTCTQVMGGAGLWTDNGMHRLTSLAQMLKIVDGTSEIQKVVLGRDLYRQAKLRNPQ